MEDKKEDWRDIPGYEGFYQASNTGKIKTLETRRVQPRFYGIRIYPEKLLSEYITKKGYHVVSLHKNGKGVTHRVNRLVAQAWLPNPENHPVVNHIDGNKSNNSVENLEWCTIKHNVHHARDTGLNNNYGQTHHTAKLKESDVLTIREMVKSKTQTAIASLYDVSIAQINYIVNRKQWKHI